MTECGAILDRDAEIIKPRISEIVAFIDDSPFSKRIKFLLDNQQIGEKLVKDKDGKLSPPNCLGTAFYVAGLGLFKHPYHAREDELWEHLNQPKRMGYVWPYRENMIPGAFIFSKGEGGGWHGGIYLGAIGKEDIFFAQHCHGGPFGSETLRCYEYPAYYLPKTILVKKYSAR